MKCLSTVHPGQSYDCPIAIAAKLKNMNKRSMKIHSESMVSPQQNWALQNHVNALWDMYAHGNIIQMESW